MLNGLGANAEEARINADGIVSACLWWHPGQGQGLRKLFRYARRMRNGGIVPDAKMQWVTERTSTALLDAAKGLGYVSAHRAMAKAIEKARTTGIAMVGVQHSNHFGVAGYHASQAADAGMIGVAMTNAGAEMAPWGSAQPVLGTNPWGMKRSATGRTSTDRARYGTHDVRKGHDELVPARRDRDARQLGSDRGRKSEPA